MRLASLSLLAVTAASGTVGLAVVLTLAISRTPLGAPLFFSLLALFTVVYATLLARVWRACGERRRAFQLALLFAVLFRVPLALSPVNSDSDMVRYLWDGRVQQQGLNPFAVIPADPALSATHTAESARMPSLRARTPYPPGAQLFFRLVVAVHDSTLAMKLALVLCDLLTILLVARWLRASGRSEWLAVAYAWNPLVVLEVAHSGHIDALGALWIAASACWLTERRTLLATLAFVMAVATKLLPIVLVPLLIGRVRIRDAAIGVALLGALYFHYHDPAAVTLGAVPNVVAYIRFNGPVFRGLAALLSPQGAAAVALLAGITAAAVARWRYDASDPAAWAWPMALALVCAPVIYPWYLLYLTPFLFTRSTLPLLAWCVSGLAAYVVWDISRHGGRWIVPPAIQAFELAVPILVAGALAAGADRRARQASQLAS
jgi:alpha-1,6-mannosyltransferase